MNVELLRRLKAAAGDFVPSGALGGTPESVARDVDEWSRFGYELERHPYLGVAYRGPAERLCPDLMEHGLVTQCVGKRIAVWEQVSSTNDVAARAAHSRANEGLVVLADSQSAGRGRRGNTWTAPAGSSVLMSILLFPDRPLDDPTWLTALGAVATADVVASVTCRPAQIKWPNDVRVDGRKVAGILVERNAGSILGIGINVNLTVDEFPPELRQTAVSLRIVRGERLDRSEIARDLIEHIDRLYEEGRARGPGALSARWRDRLEAMGRHVQIQALDGDIEGRLVDADLTTGLRLAHPDGSTRGITLSEIQAVRECPRR